MRAERWRGARTGRASGLGAVRHNSGSPAKVWTRCGAVWSRDPIRAQRSDPVPAPTAPTGRTLSSKYALTHARKLLALLSALMLPVAVRTVAAPPPRGGRPHSLLQAARTNGSWWKGTLSPHTTAPPSNRGPGVRPPRRVSISGH